MYAGVEEPALSSSGVSGSDSPSDTPDGEASGLFGLRFGFRGVPG